MKITAGFVKTALMQKFKIQDKFSATDKRRSDSVTVSDTAKVMDKVDDFLNLGKSSDVSLSSMNETEREEFIKVLTTLIKHGIMGYDDYEIDGKRYKIFLANQIGDKRLNNVDVRYINENEEN